MSGSISAPLSSANTASSSLKKRSMAPSPSKGCPSTDAKTTKPSTSKGGPTKNNKIVTPSIVTDNSKTYSKNEKLTYSYMNYPQKPDKLPVIITQPKDDYLNRKAIFGPRRGQFLRFNGVDENPYEVNLFYEHRFV